MDREQRAAGCWAFVRAIFSETWVYFAYGGGAVVLAFWGYLSGRTPPVWLFLAVFVLGFFVGGFRTWQKERVDRNAIVRELADLKNGYLVLQQQGMPALLIEIEAWQQQVVHEMSEGEGIGGNIVLDVSVRNSGARTGLADWKLEVPSITDKPIEPRDDLWQQKIIEQNRGSDLAAMAKPGIHESRWYHSGDSNIYCP